MTHRAELTVAPADEGRVLAGLADRGVLMHPWNSNTLHHDTVVEGAVALFAGIDNHRPSTIGAFSYSHSVIGRHVVRLGRYCSIGEDVEFGASNHPSSWLTSSPFAYHPRHPPFTEHRARTEGRGPLLPWGLDGEEYGGGVSVGNDVWIGSGAFIRGGVHLGDGCIVGARAVVTKDVPPYGIVVGNPGRLVKQRFPDDLIADLLELRWWDYDFTSFGDVDLRDTRAAVDELAAMKAAGLLQPYVSLGPFGQLLAEVLAG